MTTGETKQYCSSTRNGYNSVLNKKISDVFKVFDVVFQQYRSKEIFLSFNGGKDCTVLLDLVQKYIKKENCSSIRYLYIQSNDPFEEIEEFVSDCEKLYNIEIEKAKGNLKTVLEDLCKRNVDLKAVIMGSRRSDPYCHDLKSMQLTDPGWPPLMRVNPVLDWSCKDVWDYILSYKIPYCKLYDIGYTSIGDKSNTLKNPHLKVVDPNTGDVSYLPAYRLLDDSLERAGRTSRS